MNIYQSETPVNKVMAIAVQPSVIIEIPEVAENQFKAIGDQ